MSFQKTKVGSDIKYLCPRCNLELAHTVLAMMNGEPARIRCNTCKSERNYRRSKDVERVLIPSQPRPKISAPDIYQAKLRENAAKTPRPYRIDETFEVNDVVMHSKFGKGVVTKILYPDRAEILFQDEMRTLMCRCRDQEAQ